MARSQARLVASSLIDWTGTGFYLRFGHRTPRDRTPVIAPLAVPA